MPELGTCPTCGKNPRALLYCRKEPCGFRSPLAAVDLPRPKIETTKTPDGKDHLVISRDGRGRTYEIEGSSDVEKVKNTVKKVLDDGYTGEWLP